MATKTGPRPGSAGSLASQQGIGTVLLRSDGDPLIKHGSDRWRYVGDPTYELIYLDFQIDLLLRESRRQHHWSFA